MEKQYIQNLKYLRKSKGFSQKDLGEKLGIAHSNYNTIENGLAELTVSRLFKIAEILDVSVFQILLESDKEVNKEIENIKKSMAFEQIREEIRREYKEEIRQELKQIEVNFQTVFKKVMKTETPEQIAEMKLEREKIIAKSKVDRFGNPK